MELTLAELSLLDLVEALKTVADTQKRGPMATLVAHTAQVIKRLRWAQTSVTRLATGDTTPQALKAGIQARGAYRSAWAQGDAHKKTKAQMLESDHKAKELAEAAVLKRRRPRGGRPGQRGNDRRPAPESDWGRGLSKGAKKRRRAREAKSLADKRTSGTPPPKKKQLQQQLAAKHKNKKCDLCHQVGHIKYNCPTKNLDGTDKKP